MVGVEYPIYEDSGIQYSATAISPLILNSDRSVRIGTAAESQCIDEESGSTSAEVFQIVGGQAIAQITTQDIEDEGSKAAQSFIEVSIIDEGPSPSAKIGSSRSDDIDAAFMILKNVNSSLSINVTGRQKTVFESTYQDEERQKQTVTFMPPTLDSEFAEYLQLA